MVPSLVDGGNASVRHMGATGATRAGFTVRSPRILLTNTNSLSNNAGDGFLIETGATGSTANATISSNGGTGIANSGNYVNAYTTITHNGSGGIAGPGTATLKSSIVAEQIGGVDCAGAITSGDYNLDSAGTCGLAGPNDITGVSPALDPLSVGTSPGHYPSAASPAIDSIPFGAADCVAAGAQPLDQYATARPINGDCDRAAIEADFALDLTVDTADVAPGDRVCDDGTGSCTLRAAVDETNSQPASHRRPQHHAHRRCQPRRRRQRRPQPGRRPRHLDPVTIEGYDRTITGSGTDRVISQYDNL